MHTVETQLSHLRGYKNCFTQTSCFNVYEHCVSKKKNQKKKQQQYYAYEESDIFQWKKDL